MEIAAVITTRGNEAKFKKILELMPEITVISSFNGICLPDGSAKNVHFKNPYTYVDISMEGDDAWWNSVAIGLAIEEFSTAYDELNPDIVMVVGDRWETLAAVTAAYTMRIPVAHLEGGEVSGALDHGYRYAISALSKYHFVCTEKAKERLRFKKNIYNVGATSLDSLLNLEAPFIIKGNFLLITYHPDTLSDYNDLFLKDLIDAVSGYQCVWISPNVDSGSNAIKQRLRKSSIHIYDSFPIEQYGWLMKNCMCMVGNSSSGIREANFLGTPFVLIGDRQKGRECGPNVFKGLENLDTAISSEFEPDYTYGDGHASERIVECLQHIQI